MNWGLKGGISIDAYSGPCRHVLWCCGGICHQLLTFCYSHTVRDITFCTRGFLGSEYYWHTRILRPKAPFYRSDCTHRSKFLIHVPSFLFESETWKIFSYLLKTMEDFFFLLSTACFSRLNLISNGFNFSLLFFFWAVELAKFAFLLDFTIFTKYFTKKLEKFTCVCFENKVSRSVKTVLKY